MFDNDEAPKDWELKDEEPPEALRKKWERDEAAGPKTVPCPSCKKETPADSLTCIFCETVIIPQICPVGCFLNWVKRLFRKN